ncbi:MCP four helix bundle domain-containing protein [Brumimicrobium mesophilum]|uniref:hypothetical protein n=1 Tax=Brumimicrobium mesophilum TaxID=392717 RepID=UPI000D141D56|nr:hypothetical protein [Brumimicrobium mesophilum]
MKWTYIIKNKVTASVALISLCLLALLSNYIDRNHTDNVKNMISTMYEDRLIAEEYIFRMTSSIYQIKEVIRSDDNKTKKVQRIDELLLNIKDKNLAYQETKLTEIELIKAEELMIVLSELETIHSKNKQDKLEIASESLGILDQLSNIQLVESKKIMKNAEALYSSSRTSSQFVFALIIVILLVLQALVFASKTPIARGIAKKPNLN